MIGSQAAANRPDQEVGLAGSFEDHLLHQTFLFVPLFSLAEIRSLLVSSATAHSL